MMILEFILELFVGGFIWYSDELLLNKNGNNRRDKLIRAVVYFCWCFNTTLVSFVTGYIGIEIFKKEFDMLTFFVILIGLGISVLMLIRLYCYTKSLFFKK